MKQDLPIREHFACVRGVEKELINILEGGFSMFRQDTAPQSALLHSEETSDHL